MYHPSGGHRRRSWLYHPSGGHRRRSWLYHPSGDTGGGHGCTILVGDKSGDCGVPGVSTVCTRHTCVDSGKNSILQALRDGTLPLVHKVINISKENFAFHSYCHIMELPLPQSPHTHFGDIINFKQRATIRVCNNEQIFSLDIF